MVPPFNFRGYTGADPLDRAPRGMQLLLTMIVSAGMALSYLYLQSYTLNVLRYKSVWVYWIGFAVFTIVVGPLLALLRKSSSLLFFLMIASSCLADIWLQAHFRDKGLEAWWTYQPGNFLYAIPVPLKFLVAWSFPGIIQGPLVLWVTRLVASMVYPAGKATPEPTFEQQGALFPDEWTNEVVEKPRRDLAFWALRLLGLGYLSYLLFCLVGILGASPWPHQARTLIEMTYANPALAINTFSKISLMVLLAFTAAYNARVRWHATLGLFVGHLASTIASLGFYFYNDPPGSIYHDFLRTSAMVDGGMLIIFGWILIRYRGNARAFAAEKQFPDFFSLPDFLNRVFFYLLGAQLALMIPVVILLRVRANGSSGLGAVFGYPDPQLGNTVTMAATMSLLSFLMARRVKLRDYLLGVLLFGLVLKVAGEGLWSIAGPLTGIGIQTRIPSVVAQVDWYFVLAAALDALVVALIIALRKMYYDIDYTINSLNPSSARNVIGFHESIFDGNAEDGAAVLQKIDRHVAGIRGRKRGLLNFPFWIVEHILCPLYWLHPTFSTMSADEQRYFLHRSVLRPPRERARAFIPAAADVAYKIGMAVHAFITFAHFTRIRGWEEAGYVSPDARNRLQGNYPTEKPPFTDVAALPPGPSSPENDKPRDPPAARPLIAPRVSTPVLQAPIPDDVDYLIIGSGAGGACMAYRLACAVDDPSRVLVVERGPRYSPLQDFNDDEMEMIRKLYKEGGLQQSKRFDLMVLQGECVGGTTVVNNAVCFAMPDRVRNVWQNEYDIDLSALKSEYDRVAEEIEITQIPDVAINQRVRERFFAGVDKYNAQPGQGPGLKEEVLSANQRNMMGDGLDNLGNKRLRKRSMLETYLPWAEARGVKVIGETSAVRFLMDSGGKRAEAVMLRSTTGDLKNVKVRKAVILAGGVIASSHVLMRSEIKNNVGRGMSCNFAFPVAFEFGEVIDAFDGTQITLGAVDQQNRAVFETYFNPPGAFALSLPFYFNRLRDLMGTYRYLVNFGALVGAEPNGVIKRRGDPITGRPFTWSLGDQDRMNIKYALETLLEIGMLAGATRGILPTEPGLEIPLTRDNLSRFTRELEAYPLQMSDLRLTTAHPQGGNRMAGDNSAHRSERVVDARFRVDGLENVFVADASVFPTGITVNPQWTIMAMSSMAAKCVLELAARS
ncbi:MAG TPA: GMC family oxidoreductase N-terminal domain-containing protein [Blastocatellia bacterium]|nr:GMC family oxidoreductase N-terminal domain-containing protein [Blastocatellia bacterium]